MVFYNFENGDSNINFNSVVFMSVNHNEKLKWEST